MARILDVYLHEKRAGQLTQDNAGNLRFQYNPNYVARDQPAISICMPVQSQAYDGPEVRSYFSGLLPDEIARHRLARYLGVSEKNAFALLEVIGGECAGALSLYPVGETPPAPNLTDIEKLDSQKLREILDLLKRRPLMAGEDNVRLSLAGAQDKIAVTIQDGDIALVKGTTPTTHIIKPIIEDIHDSVHNELFCLRLANLIGIETPEAHIRWLENTPYFLVKRYDRQQGETLQRLHQEDFCQALGIAPEFKYEREGGPGIAQGLELLKNHSAYPGLDRTAFIQRVIFNYLIGNGDAHGKNYSLLYKGKLPVLSPAYDLLCTTVYPNLSRKMAMKIGGRYDPDTVFLHQWYQLIPETASSRKFLEKELKHMAQTCLTYAEDLKNEFHKDGIVSSILGDICAVIKQRSNHILQQF